MRLTIARICCLTTLLTTLCISTVSAANSDHSVKELMGDLGDTMLRMLPEAYSENPDKTRLLENLVRIEYLLNQAAPHFTEGADGAQVTFEVLQQRLKEAREFGTTGSVSMLQSTISEAFTLCATCHVQDRLARRAFDRGQTKQLTPYLAVEYRFLTREYDAALKLSDQYFQQNKRTRQQDNMMLQRLLTIGVEVQRDLEETIKRLTAVRQYLDHDDFHYTRVNDWISVLQRLQQDHRQLQSPMGSSLAALDRFLTKEWPDIRTLLNYNQQEAYWVAIRGELNRHLRAANNQSSLPQIYYWLAVADRELQYRFYGSLSRAYLETCITEFPASPYANRCLDEYEFLVLISFSGSGGTRVPPEVNERISEMRRLIAAQQ